MAHKANKSKQKQRERWKSQHPGLTRKEFAKKKRQKRLEKLALKKMINSIN